MIHMKHFKQLTVMREQLAEMNSIYPENKSFEQKSKDLSNMV